MRTDNEKYQSNSSKRLNDYMQRYFQNPVKYVRWVFLQK